MGILLFALALLVVIMIHEAGHFLTAKAFNFKATKFFVGFGPTVWSFHKGETEYGIKALPLGGYVRIVGMNPYEEVPPEDQPRSYPNKPRWQRALVIAAGPATHWVVGFLILVVALMTIGIPTGELTNEVAIVEDRIEGTLSPASLAGFERGDRVVAVGGSPTESWDEIRAYIRAHPGETGTFTVDREGEQIELEVLLGQALVTEDGDLRAYSRPGEDLRSPKVGEQLVGFLGVQPDSVYEKESLGGAVVESGSIVWDLTTGSVAQIGQVFAPIFNGDLFDALTGAGERPEGVGLIGAGRIAGQTVDRGQYLRFIELIVVLTIFLGIMNLLPLVPLDGGHLAVIGFEAITRKRVDMRRLIPFAAAVISFFLVMFFAFLYLDLVSPPEIGL